MSDGGFLTRLLLRRGVAAVALLGGLLIGERELFGVLVRPSKRHTLLLGTELRVDGGLRFGHGVHGFRGVLLGARGERGALRLFAGGNRLDRGLGACGDCNGGEEGERGATAVPAQFLMTPAG